MSKHPIGPWTETVNQFYTGNVFLGRAYYSSSSGSILSAGARGTYVQRSGTNNGKLLKYKPSSAELIQYKFYYDKLMSYTCHNTAGNTFRADVVCGSYLPNSIDSWVASYLPTSHTENRAYIKLIGKVGPAFLAGVAGGEIRETKDTLKHAGELILSKANNATQDLSKLVQAAHRGNLRYVASDIADKVLEFNFGVAPLINDISSLAKAVARDQSRLSRQHVSGSFSVQAVDNLPEIKVTDSIFGVGTYNTENRVMSHKIKFGGVIDLDVAVVDDYINPYGLGMDQVGVTAWNLLPNTWLADYFVNIQDYFTAASLRRGLISDGYRVEIRKSLARTKIRPGVTSGLYYLPSSSPGVYIASYLYFKRSPFSIDSYLPHLEARVPSLAQTANVAALFVSRFAKLLPTDRWSKKTKLTKQQVGTLINLINSRIIK